MDDVERAREPIFDAGFGNRRRFFGGIGPSYGFQTKNKPKFNKWAKIARENGSKSPNFIRYIDYFEKELNKL